jgi:hypothetical protein
VGAGCNKGALPARLRVEAEVGLITITVADVLQNAANPSSVKTNVGEIEINHSPAIRSKRGRKA